MATRGGQSLLIHTPTAAATVNPTITHSQLRHLVSCPQRRGTVYFVSEDAILESDLLNPTTPPRSIIKLDYRPTCFATSAHPSNSHALLLAAGGLYSNIHISLHALSQPSAAAPHAPPKTIWSHETTSSGHRHQDIVNYVFFSPAELTDGTSLQRATAASSSTTGTSGVRLIVCGNDASVRFYDVALHTQARNDRRLQPCGTLCLDTCVNHASISPDGRTLLCAGDTPYVYLHRIIPGASIAFESLAQYTIPLPPPAGVRSSAVPIESWSRRTSIQMAGHATRATPTPSVSALNTFQLPTHTNQTPSTMPSYTSTTTHVFPFADSLMAPRACFTTAWTSDGHKFAVAAQEGALAVWDVRSSVPVWVFWTGMRNSSPRRTGAAGNTGDSDGSWDWTYSEVAAGQGGRWRAVAGQGDGWRAVADQGGGWTAEATMLNGSTREIARTTVEAEESIFLNPAGAQADPSHPILGVVRTRVDPRLPVQTILDADPDMGQFGAEGSANGIRNVRFNAGEEGRDLCVFVEHAKNIHVIDARTFDPATHRVFVFPDLGGRVAPTTDNSTGVTSDIRPHAEASPETMEQERGPEVEPLRRERGEMVWALMPGEDRERAWGDRERQGSPRPGIIRTPTSESNMQLEETHPAGSRPPVQDTDASRERESDVLGWLGEPTRSRSPPPSSGQPEPDSLHGMRFQSRSPPSVIPFPRAQSRSDEAGQPIIVRGADSPARMSRSRSPPVFTSFPPDSRDVPASTLEAAPEPAHDSPDQVARSALRAHTQRRQSESGADSVTRGTWGPQGSVELRDRVAEAEGWPYERRNVADWSEWNRWNPEWQSDRRGHGSGTWTRRSSQNPHLWVSRTWNNSGARNRSGQSGSGGRTQVTAEGIVEFLDADGDVITRESDGREHEQQTIGQSRNRTRLRDLNESANTGSGALPFTNVRPSPPSPFRPSPRTSPQPHSLHGAQAPSATPALPSVVESTEQRRVDEPTITGVCFDPTGEWLYVAGTGGIVEWRVEEREAGKGTGIGGWL